MIDFFRHLTAVQHWDLFLAAHTTSASFLLLFLTGFTYSLYHCVGMCGGFVVAYSTALSPGAPPQNSNIGQRIMAQWPLHLLFNLGRVVSYTVIGAVMGLAGSLIVYVGRFGAARLQGFVGIAGGILMIAFGLSLVGFIRMPAGTMLGGSPVRRLFGSLLRSTSPWRTFPMGLLVGTVPCGLVYSMSSYALASGSAVRGAMVMASFGLGTIPAMFCFGFVSTVFSAHARRGLLWAAVVMTVIMGVEAIRRGAGLV